VSGGISTADIRFVESVGEPQAEAVAMPVQSFHLVVRAIEEDEQHRVEHRDLDILLDQGRQNIDGFAEFDRLGVDGKRL
jgi:hypothetical protein